MARHITLTTILLLSLLGRVSLAVAADIAVERAALYQRYGQQLDTLASQCDQQQRADAAHQVRTWLPVRAPDQLTFFVLPASIDLIPKSASVPDWQVHWLDLRTAQAEALFALAHSAAAQRQGALAYELTVETVRENPNHRQARHLLGYVESKGAWVTPFERTQLASGKIYDAKFGWLPAAQVERYQRGERFFRGRWMSAAEESALRTDIKQGWHIESEHYLVTTNHSLEEGVRLSQQLETLFTVWQQAFLAFQLSDAELARRFEHPTPAPRDTKQHNVTYFRNRQEYNAALKPLQPQIGITLGIYFAKPRMAYFFADNAQHTGTLYHEATHQLFQETRMLEQGRKIVEEVGKTNNFWIVEGIACYMESLAPCEGYCTLGGDDSGRMPAARYRLLEDRFYVPLEELTRMGMEPLQRDPRINQLYSQSAGQADFFMHAKQGAYREPLIRYLQAIYTGRANPKTLSEFTGAQFSTLDAEYKAFMGPGQRPAATGQR